MNINQSNVDEFGMLLFSGIHDSTVIELNLKNEELKITLESIERKIILLTIKNAKFLSLNNIWGLEIINSIYAKKLRNCFDDPLLTQDIALKNIFSNRIWGDYNVFFEGFCQKYPHFFLIYFETSYGGDISSICENIFMENIS